jgi:peroxiredoxin
MSSATESPRTESPRVERQLPRPGESLPAFALTDAAGSVVRLRDFKQRRPVLLAFLRDLDSPANREWLARLARERGRLDELRTAVLVVAPAPVERLRRLQTELDLPFALLADADGQTAAAYLPAGDEAPDALYAADRYNHCLARWLAPDASGFPPLAKVFVEFAFAEQEDCACGLPAWDD